MMTFALLYLLTFDLSTGVFVSPAIDKTYPFDYNVSIRADSKQADISYWNERKQGSSFHGFDGKFLIKNGEFKYDFFYKDIELRDILRGGTTASFLYGDFLEFGISQTWDHNNPATSLHFGFGHKYLSAGFNLWKHGIESAELKNKIFRKKSGQKDFRLFQN